MGTPESFDQFTTSVEARLAAARQKTLETGDAAAEEQLLSELEATATDFERTLNPFEQKLGLAAQYESQTKLLDKVGVPHTLEALNYETPNKSLFLNNKIHHIAMRFVANNRVFSHTHSAHRYAITNDSNANR